MLGSSQHRCLKKISRDFIYDRIVGMSLEETCNVILAHLSYEYLFKDKQLKVIGSILRREDKYKSGIKKFSFSLQMQF